MIGTDTPSDEHAAGDSGGANYIRGRPDCSWLGTETGQTPHQRARPVARCDRCLANLGTVSEPGGLMPQVRAGPLVPV